MLPGHAPRFFVPGEGPTVDEDVADVFQRHVLVNASRARLDKVTAAVVLIDLAVELLKRNGFTPERIARCCSTAAQWHFDPLGGGRR